MRHETISNESQLILAIKEDQILVAPEGQVDIHIGIINQGTHEDYFDILVNGIPADWTTLDNPVVHLAAGEVRQVILTVRPPALLQDRVGQYPLDISAVSQAYPNFSAVAHGTLIVGAYQSEGRIGVALGSIYFSVTPGASVTVPILLQNHGLREDAFQLNIEGIPPHWISTSAVVTKLGPSQSREIEFTIRPPRSSEARVGRTPFKIQLISRDFPDQKAEVDCILTVGAFWKFSASLEPALLQAGQLRHLSIANEGNTAEAYSLSFQDPANLLKFEKEVQIVKKEVESGAQKIEITYVEIPPDEKIQIEPGGQGNYGFRSQLKSRPIVGNEKTYPFEVKVLSAEHMSKELAGEVSERGWLPPWLAILLVTGSFVLCLFSLLSFNNVQAAAKATQTAAFAQTQAATGQSSLALTATALAISSTPLTVVSPTNIPTQTPLPTYTSLPTITAPPTNTNLPTNTPVIITTTPLPTNTPLPTTTSVALPTNTMIVPSTATPIFPALNGVMVFESNRDGNPEIYAMNLANQSVARLTNNSAVNMQPALAPDGMRVAYVSNQNGNNEIYVTGLDLRPPVNLTNNSSDDQQPTWSPDGNWIAFTSNRDGNQEIYIMRSDGSNVHNLTSNPASDFAPTWFSVPRFLGLGTEDWIAFTSNRDGNLEVYKVRPDGTGLTNLTKNPANDYSPSGFAGGNLLAFVTDRDGNPEIYTMTSDGGSPTNITNNAAQDLDPAISSDGKWVTFTSDRDGNLEVYVVNLADGKTYNLTRNPSEDQYPDW